MGLIFREAQPEGVHGVSLAQLNAVTDQATREAINRGIDPETVHPKVRANFGGTIKSVEFEIG